MANERIIWDYLKTQGLSDAGIAGVMGNLYAESALNPKNLQNSYEKSLGFTDETYTEAVDNGTYSNFVNDSAGYGLAQWTYWSRKRGLLEFARSQKKSISSITVQLGYLMKELSLEYGSLLSTLKSTFSVSEATRAFMLQFEKPADQSESKQAQRVVYARKYYGDFVSYEESSDFTNSSLVSYTKLSPHHSGRRTHEIDTVSIHCMAGNLSVEVCGELFQTKEASSNYGIGSDGRIALYVEEANRSWCTSNTENDNRAITIEVANSVARDPWPVSDKAYAALIDLLTDICIRNKIKRLLWKADKTLIGQVDKQNMTVHRWFAAKACPGDWLYSRHGQIADEVNMRLENYEKQKEEEMAKDTATQISYDEFLKMYKKARDETDPFYKNLEDVPEYWQKEVQKLVETGAIKGDGTNQIGKRRSELMALVPAIRYVDWYFGNVNES